MPTTTAVLSFPPSDLGLLEWSVNYRDLITAQPTDYGLTAGDATSYGTVHTAYATALAACSPTQRNKGAVAAKNAARASLKNAAALLANKINSDASVTDAQKVTLGIPPRARPTQIPAPGVRPVIQVLSVSGTTAKIRLKDGEAGERRGKPPGTTGASVFSFVGPTAPTDISQWVFEGNTGRVTEIDIAFDNSLAPGTKVFFTAFWFNGRKQSGPMADAVSANLPGGGVSGGGASIAA